MKVPGEDINSKSKIIIRFTIDESGWKAYSFKSQRQKPDEDSYMEMSQDREQWRRKTIEWSSAVANRHRRWSTSE